MVAEKFELNEHRIYDLDKDRDPDNIFLNNISNTFRYDTDNEFNSEVKYANFNTIKDYPSSLD